MSSHSHRSWQLPFGSQPELQLRADATSVAIVPIEGDETPRLEAIGRGAERLDLRIDRVGDAVNVAIEPFRQFTWWGGWDTRLVLHVPPTVKARVETSAGSIDVRHLDGCDLDLKANAGRIELNNVRGRLKLAADAGSIRGHDVAGRIWAETQAGSIRLEITGLEPGEHRVRASMGQVRVDLAQGLEVRVESRASMGSSRVSYPSYPNASAVLQLSTEMGAIRVGEGMSAAAWSAQRDVAHTNGYHDVPGGVPPHARTGPSAPPAGWQQSPPPGAARPTESAAPAGPTPAAPPTPANPASWPFSGEPPLDRSAAPGATPPADVSTPAPSPATAPPPTESNPPTPDRAASEPPATAGTPAGDAPGGAPDHPATPLHAAGVGEGAPGPATPEPQQPATEASSPPPATVTDRSDAGSAQPAALAPSQPAPSAEHAATAGSASAPEATAQQSSAEGGSSSTASSNVGAAASGDGELERILEMVASGDLSARDAEELLRAMGRV